MLEKSQNTVARPSEQLGFSAQDIVEMIFFPVVNEACRVLDEGIAVKAADVDVASVPRYGFPSVSWWDFTLGRSNRCEENLCQTD